MKRKELEALKSCKGYDTNDRFFSFGQNNNNHTKWQMFYGG